MKLWKILILSLSYLSSSISLFKIAKNINSNQYVINDENNNQVFFKGVNAVVKGSPYHPKITNFDYELSLVDKDFQILYNMGVNLIRLGTMWSGFEPEKGKFNATYINNLKTIIRNGKKYDTFFILDMHQDVLSEAFCGEGLPLWTINTNTLLKFPIPLSTISYDTINKIPSKKDCSKKKWPAYYISKAVSKNSQDLYNGRLLPYIRRFWSKVAQEFSNETNVIGYELINEPWPGDIYTNPLRLIPEYANRFNLQEFYKKLSQSIRIYDNNTLIFFAPITWSNDNLGFTESPDEKCVLAYHWYTPPQKKKESELYIKKKVDEANYLKCASMITELDRPFLNSSENNLFHNVTYNANKYLQSWIIWEYKPFCNKKDFGACITGYGGNVWKNNTHTNTKIVNILTTPYPIKINGYIDFYQYDSIKNTFELSYDSYCNKLYSRIYLPKNFVISNQTNAIRIISDIGDDNYINIFVNCPKNRNIKKIYIKAKSINKN